LKRIKKQTFCYFPSKKFVFPIIYFIFAAENNDDMVTTIDSRHTIDSYWNIIKHLSPDAKLDLITMLTKSLKKTTSKRVSAKKYYGIWGDDNMSDDEFLDELKTFRK
jgi:hypothetical protein